MHVILGQKINITKKVPFSSLLYISMSAVTKKKESRNWQHMIKEGNYSSG